MVKNLHYEPIGTLHYNVKFKSGGSSIHLLQSNFAVLRQGKLSGFILWKQSGKRLLTRFASCVKAGVPNDTAKA